MTPRVHTRLVFAGSLIGFLAGGAFFFHHFVTGQGEVPFWVFPGVPFALAVLPMAIGFGWLRPRCQQCGGRLRYMRGRHIAWFCRACRTIHETGVPGGGAGPGA